MQPPELKASLDELEECRCRCADLQRQLDILMADRTETENKVLQMMTSLCENQKIHHEKETDALKATLKELKIEHEESERIRSSMNIRTKNLEKEILRLQHELKEAQENLEEMRDRLNKEVHEEVGALKVMNSDLNQKVRDTNEENERLKSEIGNLEEQKDLIDEQLEEMKTQITEGEHKSSEALKLLLDEMSEIKLQKAEIRCRLLEAERENTRLKAAHVQSDGIDGKAEMERLQKSVNDSKSEIGDLKRSIKEHEQTIELIRSQLDRCREENEILRRDYDEARQELDDRTIENGGQAKYLEKQIADLKEQNIVLKDVCKDLDVQCEDLMKLRHKDKVQIETLSDQNQQLHVTVQTLKPEHDRCKETIDKLKKEKEKLESSVKYWKEEVYATEHDYREEILNLGRQMASEKGIGFDHVKQLEIVKDTKRELESKILHLQANLHALQKEKDMVEDEKQLFEEKITSRMADMEDQHRDREAKMKKLLHETIEFGEKTKKDHEKLKSENDQLRKKAEEHEIELLKINATILQYQKLNTHLHTQLNNLPKRGCFVCPERKLMPNPNAITSDRMEEILAEYRQRNADLQNMVRTLQNTLAERTKLYEAVKRPREKLEISGRDLAFAIVKKSASMNSDISTGTSNSEGGRMRHNIPHRWLKQSVHGKRTKCMACMEDIASAASCAKCEACKATVHHQCAENLMNTCGLPMLYSDHFFEEEKRMHDSISDARMYGWIKLWSSEMASWYDVWANLDNKVVTFYRDLPVAATPNIVKKQQRPMTTIDLKKCTWKIHLRSTDKSMDKASGVQDAELPYVIEIKINAERPEDVQVFYMIMPDLIAKQRWLAAFQKAIPQPIVTSRMEY